MSVIVEQIALSFRLEMWVSSWLQLAMSTRRSDVAYQDEAFESCANDVRLDARFLLCRTVDGASTASPSCHLLRSAYINMINILLLIICKNNYKMNSIGKLQCVVPFLGTILDANQSIDQLKVKVKWYRSSEQVITELWGGHLPYGITQCYLPPDISDRPRQTPARQASTRFIYPGGMVGGGDSQTRTQLSINKTYSTNKQHTDGLSLSKRLLYVICLCERLRCCRCRGLSITSSSLKSSMTHGKKNGVFRYWLTRSSWHAWWYCLERWLTIFARSHTVRICHNY